MRHLLPEDDLPVLTYRDDDGLSVEPEWYAPVLPMLLINGARGIGTGYSTFIPSYKPTTIKTHLVNWLVSGCDDSVLTNAKLIPWYRGYTGTITEVDSEVVMTANYTYNQKTKTLIVKDLPIETWTSEFKQMLDAFCEKKEFVKDYTDTSTDTDVNFEIVLLEDMPIAKIEKVLGLSQKIKTTNMHVFDSSGRIRKYENVNEMLIEYAKKRLELYVVRKANMLKDLRARLPYHTNVVRFLQCICNDTIDIRRKTTDECNKILDANEIQRMDGTFEYLLKLPLSSMTQENITKHQVELEKLLTRISKLESMYHTEMWLEDLSTLKV
jgi:DNA topoisomerase-2